MSVLLDPPAQRWECPNCDATDVTHHVLRPDQAASRFHNCRGLRGISAPMVPAGTRCKVEARDREDYVGTDCVQTDADGRPLMSVVTVRDDGQDCVVFAPCATINYREHP